MSTEYSYLFKFQPCGIAWRCFSVACLLLGGVITGCTTNIAKLPLSKPQVPGTSEGALSWRAHGDNTAHVSARKNVPDSFIAKKIDHKSNDESDKATLENSAALMALEQNDVLAAPRLNIKAVQASLEPLLYSLAHDSGYELTLVGSVDARVTTRLQEATLPDILDALSLQAPMAWDIQGKAITVWGGAAYSRSYAIDYLNMHRSIQSRVGLATQVGTINASNGTNGSIANSSETRVDNVSEHRFWDSLNADIQGLLNTHTVADTQASHPTDPNRYSINREAGLLTLQARPQFHQAVQRYLDQLHASSHRQVLIEATVVEITLSDSYETGVDWRVLANGVNGLSAAQLLTGSPAVTASTVGRIASPAGLFSFVRQGSAANVTGTLALLEQFGDVRIVSRPRVMALNNQASVLKVVDNRVYFTAKVERSNTETQDQVTTETQIHTVPVGLVMNVTPQISGDGDIMLNVRPTLSRILGFVNDPNPELALANIRNGVPEIQVREMESMLRVKSGDLAVIGGLMQQTTQDKDTRLPGIGRLPVLKYLFSQRAKTRRQTELLIVLRPTVLEQTTGKGSRI